MIKEPIEQIISIPVIRDEKFSDKETNVSWKTIDKTAISGTHYVGSSGEIIFNQGETSKDIQIQILKSADAAGDLRFTVELNHDGLFTPKPATVSLKKIESKFIELFVVIFTFFLFIKLIELSGFGSIQSLYIWSSHSHESFMA